MVCQLLVCVKLKANYTEFPSFAFVGLGPSEMQPFVHLSMRCFYALSLSACALPFHRCQRAYLKEILLPF